MNNSIKRLAQRTLDPKTYQFVEKDYDLMVYELMKSEDVDVRVEMAEISDLDEDTIDYLILDRDRKVRRTIVELQPLTTEQMNFLIFDEDDYVVVELTKLKSLPTEAIDYIIFERNKTEQMLINIAKNNNLTKKHVVELIKYFKNHPDLEDAITENSDKWNNLIFVNKIEDYRNKGIVLPHISETQVSDNEWERIKNNLI